MATLRLGGEEFDAAISPGALFDLAAAADLEGLSALAFYRRFVFGLVDESEYERLDHVLHDHSLSFSDFTEAVAAAVGEEANRPTERPSPSPGGGSRTAGGQSRASSSRGTGGTGARSPRAGR